MIRKALLVFFILLLTVLECSICYGHSSNTAATFASATVVTPATMMKENDMEFGKVNLRELRRRSIILKAGFPVPAPGGVPAPKAAGNGAASFTVSGEINYLQALTLPSTPIGVNHGRHRLLLSAFTSSVPSAAVIVTRSLRIDIGASISLSLTPGTPCRLAAGEKFEVILHNN